MDNNSKHIDQLYKEKLDHYVPQTRSNNWLKFGFRLMILNLGSYFLYGSIIGLLGLSAAAYFIVRQDPAPLEIQNRESVPSIPLMDPIKLENDQTFSYRILPERNTFKSSSFSLELPITEGSDITGADARPDNSAGKPASAIPNQKNPGFEVNPVSNNPFNRFFRSKEAITGTKRSLHNYTFKEKELQQAELRFDFFDSITFSRKHSNQMELELSAGPSWVFNNYQHGNVVSGLSGMETNVSDNIISINTAAEIRIKRNSWFIQTGLNFSVYGEDVNYRFDSPRVDDQTLIEKIDTVYRWIYDPPNIGVKKLIRIDTIFEPLVYYVRESISAKNRYYYVDIPFLLGREFVVEQFRLDVSAGASVGFHIRSAGIIPASGYDDFLEEGEYVLSEPQVNLLFRTGIYYPVSKRLNIMVKPAVKYNLNSLFRNDRNAGAIKYFVIDLMTGIAFGF